MENLTYQRIFDAFNTNPRSPSEPAARDLQSLTATPAAMLGAMDTIRSMGKLSLFQMHKTTYLRGLMRSLKCAQWDQTYASQLIDVADWLVSLDKIPPHSTPYMTQIRILLATIPQKVFVPPQKVQEWTKLTTRKGPSHYIPKFKIACPEQVYELPFKGRSHVQRFNTDDRD